jgi:hypothetical protein
MEDKILTDDNVEKNLEKKIQSGKVMFTPKRKRLTESQRKHKLNLKTKNRVKNKIAENSRKINKK